MDTIALSDIEGNATNYIRSLSDSVTFTESFIVAKTINYLLSLSDNITLTDVLALAFISQLISGNTIEARSFTDMVAKGKFTDLAEPRQFTDKYPKH